MRAHPPSATRNWLAIAAAGICGLCIGLFILIAITSARGKPTPAAGSERNVLAQENDTARDKPLLSRPAKDGRQAKPGPPPTSTTPPIGSWKKRIPGSQLTEILRFSEDHTFTADRDRTEWRMNAYGMLEILGFQGFGTSGYYDWGEVTFCWVDENSIKYGGEVFDRVPDSVIEGYMAERRAAWQAAQTAKQTSDKAEHATPKANSGDALSALEARLKEAAEYLSDAKAGTIRRDHSPGVGITYSNGHRMFCYASEAEKQKSIDKASRKVSALQEEIEGLKKAAATDKELSAD